MERIGGKTKLFKGLGWKRGVGCGRRGVGLMSASWGMITSSDVSVRVKQPMIEESTMTTSS